MSGALPGSAALNKVAVLGAGSWGTTYAKVLADAGREVVLWARRDSVAEAIRSGRTNEAYLPGVILPGNLRATSDVDEALDGVDAVALGVPSQSMRENLTVFRSYPHMLVPPAVVLGLILLSFTFLGDGLRDAMDPHGTTQKR